MSVNIYPQSSETFSESLRKGYHFELYIRELFGERNFKVLDWRNTIVTANQQLPRSYFLLPDLELLFVRNNRYRFAVECKWRKEFFQGNWEAADRIEIYKKYQREQNIMVFIAIGIGGQPSKPAKLFVTPLDHISHSTKIEERDLIEFKRRPTQRFFYDTVQLRLF
jgi:hypothetical protein